MLSHCRRPWVGFPVIGMLCVLLPILMGQGCPGGGNNIIPWDSGLPSYGVNSGPGLSGGDMPYFEFVSPVTNKSGDIGDVIEVLWNDDGDANTAITLLVDPDDIYGNGNERIVLPVVMASDPLDSFSLDTSSLTPSTYRLIARINDQVNPEFIRVASGRLLLLGAGLLPSNISPSIIVTEPSINYGVSHDDTVDITFCGSDPDDGEENKIPDIVLMLDLDNDPTNDLDLTGPDAEDLLTEACFTGRRFPKQIDGAIVLACFQDNDCQNVANAITYTVTIDVEKIPLRDNGDPYHVRATMWDHLNPPVHSYAPGNISITALGSGVIDLAKVGRTISGSKFMGFDEGGRTGNASADLGDIDGDGADDFVLVSQLYRSYEAGNVGAAHVILGLPNGGKYGSEIPLNSIGSTYRGTYLPMGYSPGTEGIISVSRLGDVDGDGFSEMLFGLPYVEQIDDDHDDDPCDCDLQPDQPIPCYPDIHPNPFSDRADEPPSFGIGTHDTEEILGCSNDNDLSSRTPIDGGYAIMVSSQNNLTSGYIRLSAVGQNGGGASPYGARWRGPWYDQFDGTQTILPYDIIPDNRFGQTVSSMPDMHDTTVGISSRYGPVVLISAPQGMRGRGMVTYTPSQNFTNFTNGNANSFPNYIAGNCNCPAISRRLVYPYFNTIIGGAIGDELGYAGPAGDYNLDGHRDILFGAPGGDRQGAVDGGIVYVLFGRPEFEAIDIDLGAINPPRMEIQGTNTGDRFGAVQTIVGDLNQDGLPDIGFASPFADGPGGIDSGFIGIFFGGRRLTGENIFTVDQVATDQLPGVKIYGTQPGGHAGTILSNAGDFNGDGLEDMLICAPGEVRTIEGLQRKGVAYLIFGGPHLYNGSFTLAQVGTSDLPGTVFVSPYQMGSADEAPIDWVGGIGDVNSDGFDDIMIGVSKADYINPLEPSQRRVDAGEAYLIYGSSTGSNTLR